MEQPLKKSITFFPLVMIAVGSSIGSGIFISPSDVASNLNTGWQVLLVWAIGGVVALTGALTFAELASKFPGTGGVYLYIREAYGKFAAFLYGWSILMVITSGAIAALCLAFARYVSVLFDLGDKLQLTIGLTALLLVTIINIIGVKWSALFSSAMTVMKMAGIGIIVVVCLSMGQQFVPNLSSLSATTTNVSFGLALIGVLWSYGGWHHASYVGGEVINSGKILPRALIVGATIVTIVYLLVNMAYLSVMTLPELSGSSAVAADALMKISTIGGTFVAILIALSTFGTAGIFTLSTPRIYFTMGKDKVFFSWLGDLHQRFNTPVKAIVFQSGWAAVLMMFWGTFESLCTYVVFMDWIFMTMAAIGLFLFRKRQISHTGEGYRVPLYPIVPMIFILISLWFLASTLVGRPVQALAGIILVMIGWPVYYFFKRQVQPA